MHRFGVNVILKPTWILMCLQNNNFIGDNEILNALSIGYNKYNQYQVQLELNTLLKRVEAIQRISQSLVRNIDMNDTQKTFWSSEYLIEKYLSLPKKHPLSWEHHRNCSVYPLLDTVQNRPSGFVAEQKCLFSNENLRKYCTPEEIELLTTSSFTRKVKVCKRAKTVLIEDLIPWKGCAVSMIYVLKMWNGKDWDEFQTWKGGGHLSDPSAPDNMMSYWRRPQSDFDLRLTRENGMRMKLPSRIPEQPE